MELSVQSVWLSKASALVALSACLGSSTPALASAWSSQVPMASSVPLPVTRVQNSTVPAAQSWQSAGLSQSMSSAINHAITGATTHSANYQTQLNSVNALRSSLTATTHANAAWTNHSAANLATVATARTLPSATQSMFAAAAANAVTGPGLQLDLNSTNANIVLGSNIFTGASSVSIALGGKTETFSSGSSVTAAEYVAIRQVLSTGHQTLNLASGGNAVGGTFSINSVSTGGIGELVVPKGVTAYDYASKTGSTAITGDILNYGTIYGIAKAGQGNNVTINALDITNEVGGTIATRVPASVLATNQGVSSNVNLNLGADDQLNNAGTISASGSLNLTSGTGTFNNYGTLSSVNGNVNFSAPTASNITINGTGGSVQALKGDINVRDASYAGASNINLAGGDYLSRNLNLYSGTGEINGSVGQLTGTLNTVATADHLQAATETLVLGNNCVTGDPLFVNSTGNIEIDGTNTFGEDVTIIARGGITANSTGQIIAHGSNITLISGATLSSNNASDDTTTIPGTGGTAGTASNTVTVAAAADNAISETDINLSASKVINVLDSSSSSASGSAGNISLISFNGSVITSSTSILNAQGTGSGHGGNVTIIAPGFNFTNPAAISIGGVRSGGGSSGGSGGAITLVAATPLTSDGNGVTYGTNGSITSGNSFVAPTTLDTNANYAGSSIIKVGGDLVSTSAGQTTGITAGTSGGSAGAITLLAVQNINTQNLLAFGAGGAGGDATNLNGGKGGSGAPITLLSLQGSVNVAGQANSSGGGGGGAGSTAAAGGTGGAGGSAGAISIIGAASVNVDSDIVASTGGNGGNATANTAGGGGASYGGGGGGGISAATGVGAGGGSGYFGGGGGDGQTGGAAGGGGGYTAGASGGKNATAGSSANGGFGSDSLATGGSLTGAQGGSGSGTGSSGGDSISTSSGGADVTISGSSPGVVTLGGRITGKNISLTLPTGITFNGDVVGTNSVTINNTSGIVQQQNGSTYSIITPTLNVTGGNSLGFQATPLSTTAKTITVGGSIGTIFISDSGSKSPLSPVTFNSSSLTGTTQLQINMIGTGASINVGSLPSTINKLTITADTANGKINFTANNTAIKTGNAGSVVLTANEIDFTGNLSINADSSASLFSSGSITVTASKFNGTSSITLGGSSGQMALSAQGVDSTGSAGAIILNATGAAVLVGTNGLNVGYTKTNMTLPDANGAGGSITVNAATLGSASGGPLLLTADGSGTGSGGKIAVTLSTTADVTLKNQNGGLTFEALNGAAGTTATTGGSVTVSTAGKLIVDPSAININSSTGSTNVSGGTISLTGASVTNAGGGTLSLVSDGIGTGNGGKLAVTETALTGSTVTLGQTGTFYFEAKSTGVSGTGGQVTLSVKDDLLLSTDTSGNVIGSGVLSPNTYSVDIGPGGTSNNGNGGSLTLSANTITSNNAATAPIIFNATGIGTGIGGSVNVTQLDSNQNITIGKNAGNFEFVVTNGAMGLIGGKVSVTIANATPTANPSGTIIVDPTAIIETLVSKTNPNVFGGTISLTGPQIAAAPTITKTALILNASGAGKASGGTIVFSETNANASPVIGTKVGQVQLIASAGTGGGNAGSISVSSGGNLTVNTVGIVAKAAGTAGNGATIALGAANASGADNGTSGNLSVIGALSANAAGKGNGGKISLSSNSAIAFNEGLASKNTNGTTGVISATGPGGQVTLSTGGSGGIIITKAITSAEHIVISYGAGATGDLLLNSTLGSTKTADITIAPIGNASGMPTNIIASTAGKLVTDVAATSTLALGAITIQSTGNIQGATNKTTGIAAPLQMVTTQLSATADGDLRINSAITAKAILTLDQFSAGGDAYIGSAGGVTTLGFNGGVTTFSTNSTITTNAVALVATGGSTTASAGGTMNVVVKGPTSLDAKADVLSLDNQKPQVIAKIIFKGKEVDYGKVKFSDNPLTAQNTNLKTFAQPLVTSSGPIATWVISGTSAGGLDLSSDQSIYVNSTATTQLPSLALTSTGGVIQASGTIAAKVLSLTTFGTDIGTSLAPLNINASTLSIITNNTSFNPYGTAYINSVAKTALVVTGSDVGGMNLTTAAGATINGVTTGDAGFTATTKGTTALTAVTSSGDITVNSGGATTLNTVIANGSAGDITVKNTTGALSTVTNAKVYALNGSILLENDSKAGGSIVVGVGSDIETGFAGGNAKGVGGDITLAVGTPSPTNTSFTSPNITVIPSTGTIYYGPAGISALLSKTLTNTLEAKGANIIFSAPKVTNIKLSGNTKIIADPPSISDTGSSGSSSSTGGSSSSGGDIQIQPTPINTTGSIPTSPNPANPPTTITPITPTGSLYAAMPLNSQIATTQTTTMVPFQKTIAEAELPDSDARWISETEIESGLIPAHLVSDNDMNIRNDVSSVFDYSQTGGLHRGSALFAPQKDTSVATPFGTVAMAAKSMVLVLCSQNSLAVYNLDDTRAGAVRVNVGKETFSVSPGRHVLVSNRMHGEFQDLNNAQALSYRNIRARHITDDKGLELRAFTAEFNHVQSLAAVMPVRKLLASNDLHARQMTSRLLKTSAILNQLSAGGEAFQPMIRPSVVASALTHN